jgi:acyl-CoA synthetase (AMP-forming)/AMP-acid ligase II
VRAVFLGDQQFLDRFNVPLAMSAYGSTEAGGISHSWLWRRGEHVEAPEGMTRVGGRSRPDIDWAIGDDGEIRLRGREPGVLFSGYFGEQGLIGDVDEAGWLATGDLGRRDSEGRLVFIERRTESVRVKGEYVPLSHVEAAFAALPDVADVAAWKRPGDLGDDLVLYVVPLGGTLPIEAIKSVASSLPKFMKPVAVTRVTEIPRDPGVQKVQRRRLSDGRPDWVELV